MVVVVGRPGFGGGLRHDDDDELENDDGKKSARRRPSSKHFKNSLFFSFSKKTITNSKP